jgi:hypothetical protein
MLPRDLGCSSASVIAQSYPSSWEFGIASIPLDDQALLYGRTRAVAVLDSVTLAGLRRRDLIVEGE